MPEQKTRTIVNEMVDGSIIISFREFYADQWHEFTKQSRVPLDDMTDDVKQKLIDAATRWHKERKAKIAEDESRCRYMDMVDD